MAELSLAGFDDWLSVVPGPLLRATHGAAKGLTHMPIVPGSTYSILHDCFDAAFTEANRSSPDPELDLQGFDSPLWGQHRYKNFNNLTSLRPQRRLETSKESNTPRRGAAVQPERTAGTAGGAGDWQLVEAKG